MSRELKVLIIDDSEDDRELCTRALKKAFGSDIGLVELSTGESTLEVIRKEAPNCILLDYSLPGRNGLEVLKKVRTKYKNLPVIILTGQGNETVAVKAMKLGAQDYIIKSNINEETIYHVLLMAIEHCDLKERIEKQQQALALFTRALAHDLKEPVRTILSFAQLMKDESLAGEQQIYLSRIEKSAHNMNKLINSVRVYTELADFTDIQLEECDLNESLESALENLKGLITDTNTIIKSKKLPHVLGNKLQLIQVFQNIIGNAIFHSNDHHEVVITISYQERPDHYQISIADNGKGIDEAYLDAIFEPFKRLGGKSREHSGLGLSICKRIIEAAGGKIWARGALGKGTKINFTLPKCTDETLTVKGPHQLDEDWAIEDDQIHEEDVANILLVDDSVDDLYLTRLLLQEKAKIGFNMFFAQNGVEALEFLGNNEKPPIDLIILDINMPVMDGFEFLRKCKESSQLNHYPVIMCSTSDYAKDKELARELGAIDYIVKPLSKEHFLNSVDKVSNIRAISDSSSIQLKSAVARR